MLLTNAYRMKVVFAGVFLNSFFWGGWWLVSKNVYDELVKFMNNGAVIDLNVYGLVMPIGALGICFLSLASPIVAFIYNKPSHLVWGSIGSKVVNYIVGGFVLMGLVIAVAFYQWATERLETQGYSYCKPLSRISAMGRHEVYVAQSDLCVKPSNP